MLLERIVAEGLAHNSYLIGSGGEGAVIDPRRDCGIYIDIAQQNHLVIRHIFETHRNEDYVVGSLELSRLCGAAVWHGTHMPFLYGKPVRAGDKFTLGSLEITVLETPGHTEESISLVVRDRDVADEPYLVFCGDTLFAGDIARTDFYGPDRKSEMAAKIFDSIAGKILSLGDGVIVCPAHGAGSICGGDIADHPFTTVGYERQTNPWILMGREAFIGQRVTESPYLPPYFRRMEQYNRDGAPLLPCNPFLKFLSVAEVNECRKTGCQIVDIRSPTSFGGGHIPGSLSIWREGLASFMGWFLDYEKPVILVDDFNLDLDRVARHFIRLGYDNLAGVLAGGFSAWTKAAGEIASIQTCSARQLKERLEKESPFLLDVRDIRHWRSLGHIRNAHHVYVGELPQHLAEIPKNGPVVVYCDAGFKGSLAASVLARDNYRSVTNLLGGMTAWIQAGFRTDFI